MKKSISVVFILLVSSVIGMPSSSAAVTCPTGTVISTADSTKCISTPAIKEATNLQTIRSCDPGDVYSTVYSQCIKEGIYVAAGSYTGTAHYSTSCASYQTSTNQVFYNSSTGQCEVTTFSQPQDIYVGFYYYCSSSNYMTLSGDRCNGSTYGYFGSSITASKATNPCPTNYVASGGYGWCSSQVLVSSITNQTPSYTIDYYTCNGTYNGTNTVCTSSGYTTAPTFYQPVYSYTGDCTMYYTFSTAAGNCQAYVFDPLTPVSGEIYRCTEKTLTNLSLVTYYSYNASINAPYGISRTCVLYTSTVSNSLTGIYICSTVSLTGDGNILFFVSEVDSTMNTTVTTTDCTFQPYELEDSDAEDVITLYAANDPCDNLNNYVLYIICITSQA